MAATGVGATEVIGVASSLSLLSGWRLYACVLACGVAMRLGWIDLPQHLAGLGALASWWVIGAAGVGLVAEFFADKVPWLDSAWDAVHSFIRPVGGALLALAVVDPGDTGWQVATLLLGGGAALAAHGAKAGARAVLNTSPEPVSNLVASTSEDGLTAGGLYVIFAHPEWAAVLAGVLLLLVIGLGVASWRILGPLWRRWRKWGESL